MLPKVETKSTPHCKFDLELAIGEPVAKVWTAFVGNASLWWPPSLYSLAEPNGFVVEPRLGGRLYERNVNGEERDWFRVLGIEPEKSIDISGQLCSPYGPPTISRWRVEFVGTKHGTLVCIREDLIGEANAAAAESTRTAWHTVFGAGLRDYVEAQSGDEYRDFGNLGSGVNGLQDYLKSL
jgi:uncharacterized protein YndB with AHSA1/START domain